MDHYLAEIELIEWFRKARERGERARMLARVRQEAEAEMLQQSKTAAPARADCPCWHCAATSVSP